MTVISLIFLLVVLGLCWYLITLLPLPAPFPVILQILVILLALYLVLSWSGILGGVGCGAGIRLR